jgi:Flp pilus assembly protein TadB
VPAPKRKRQTKHRGDASGAVVARGRTGRKPTAEEKGKVDKKARSRASREERLNRAPTWKSAFVRAATAAVVVIGLGVIALGMKPWVGVILLPIVLIVYVPAGYYFDLWLYNRRQRAVRKATGSGKVGP